MSAVTQHWAAEYLGKPWRSGARGPEAYYCWSLVQALCVRRLGLQMPEVAVGTEQQQFGQILEASRGQGWQLVGATGARADDIVIMRKLSGDRHCGYMVEADGQLGVLHADGHRELIVRKGQPDTWRDVGEVVFDTLAQATSGGYGRFEFWRHCP